MGTLKSNNLLNNSRLQSMSQVASKSPIQPKKQEEMQSSTHSSQSHLLVNQGNNGGLNFKNCSPISSIMSKRISHTGSCVETVAEEPQQMEHEVNKKSGAESQRGG